MNDEFESWTIYKDPLDYPGQYVTRRSVIKKDAENKTQAVPDLKPLYVGSDLEAARAVVPYYAVRFFRHPDDDVAILELWL
jgi:hypothetical protein